MKRKTVIKIALTVILTFIYWVYLPFWWERFDVDTETNNKFNIPLDNAELDGSKDVGGKHGEMATPSGEPSDPADGVDSPDSVGFRVDRIYEYFEKYNCPLKDNAETFVAVADENGLDWRLLPAIAMQESSCGKQCKGFNPFGYGYYNFPDWDSAVGFVGRAISGNNPDEPAFASTFGDTREILWRYNGTVNPDYPAEVMWIMEQM